MEWSEAALASVGAWSSAEARSSCEVVGLLNKELRKRAVAVLDGVLGGVGDVICQVLT